MEDNLIISEEIDNYNYYKLVILGLLYFHEIYLKINDNSYEISDLDQKSIIYDELLKPEFTVLPGELNEEQI